MAECKTCHAHGFTEVELQAHKSKKCESGKHPDGSNCEFPKKEE